MQGLRLLASTDSQAPTWRPSCESGQVQHAAWSSGRRHKKILQTHGFPRNIIYRCWVVHIYVNLQDHPVTFGAFVCMWFDDLAIKVMNSVNSKIGYVVYWRVTCSYEYQRINGDTMVHGKDWDTFYH